MIRHQEVAVRFGHRQQERGGLAAAGSPPGRGG